MILENRQQVEAVRPNMSLLERTGKMICVSAADDEYDFVSRFFCPGEGVVEDPVTGSAHSMLIPYWGKNWLKRPCRRDRSPPAVAICAASGMAIGC